ncbi:MAG: ABC transporter ATP-binding protein [Prevotella sp.]|jgi:ABC-2 type transport system ATP-binding protein|nr:ABC transporter ATP-binding protein [Prevotella sp.]
MITISNLKKAFGETVASNIPEFQVNDGDILGLVGNNGAGKTTLFRMLLDLLKPDEGSVSIDGINPAESEVWKDSTGAYVDEGFLIDFLTPEEFFAFLGRINGITQEEVDERLKPFERLAGGEVFGQKKLIRNLSAGNKQKVGIISALFMKPKLVILDEPFNFLDPSSQNVLKHVLTDYARENKATLLISSHNLAHTIDISTRIALLEKGQIIKDLPNNEGSAKAELENYFETEAEA